MADYIGISKPLAVVGVTPKPEINYFYGPWESINEALNTIPQLARIKGLTVGIIEGSEIVEYWFKDGVDLVLKSVDPKLVVQKEEGKSLIEDIKITKLDALPSSVYSQAEIQQIANELETELNKKVTTEPDQRLITEQEATKLASAVTRTTFEEELSRVDAVDINLQGQINAHESQINIHSGQIQDIVSTYINNKGYFATLTSLQASHPTPEIGDIAYVADTLSTTGYYIYNVVDGEWTSSAVEAPSVIVPINDYALNGGSLKTLKEVTDELDLKAAHGYASNPKTLKQVDDSLVQLAGEVKEFTNPYSIIGNVTSTGNISSISAARRTGYIRALAGIEIQAYDGSTQYAEYKACVFFTVDKVFISAMEFETAGVKNIVLSDENIPEDAHYFMSCTLLAMIENSYIRIKYVANYVNNAVNMINDLDNEIQTVEQSSSENTNRVLDLISKTNPYSIIGNVTSTGNIQSLPSAMRTDYIHVLIGIEIQAYDGSTTYNEYRACVFYDKNKLPISSIAFESAGLKRFIIDETNIPENAYYFVSSTLNQYITNRYIILKRVTDNLAGNKELINETNKRIDDIDTSINSSMEKTPIIGDRATWRLSVDKKRPVTVSVSLISGAFANNNWSIYFTTNESPIAYLAYDNIPYGESRTFYLPDEYVGVYVFCISTSTDGLTTANMTAYQPSIFEALTNQDRDIETLKLDVIELDDSISTLDDSVSTLTSLNFLPINVFGNVLPKSFKNKYFGGEQDIEIVCVGDSLTGLIYGCTGFTTEQQQHLPPGMTHNHWVYQLWNRLNLNKPVYNRIDAEGKFVKTGEFNSISGGKFNLPSRNGEYSTSDLTFESIDLSASAQFSWDLDAYKKCNLIYSANQDAALSEIIIGGGNGLVEVSADKETWQEANGFEINQNTIPLGSSYTEETAYQFGIALHQRHRRIWMRAKDMATGIQSVTYRRKVTDADPLHYFYFWGTEMWNQQSVFITNLGRGGRDTGLLNCNLTDVSDRKPDLLIYVMPLANETNQVNFSQIKPYYNSYFFSETNNKGSVKTVSNDFQDFDVMMVMPHGRSAYFNGNQAVFNSVTQIEPVLNHIYMKSVFSYVEGLSETYKDKFTCINLMEQLYNEGFARGMTLQDWLASGNMTADGIHLNDLGATLWAKYLIPIFQ